MNDRCFIAPAVPLDTITPGAATMGPWRSWWSLLYLVPVDAAAGMPMASFFHTMFFDDGVEAEEGVAYTVVETGENGRNAPQRAIQQRDFQLDNALYSEFNTIGQAQYNILATKGLDSQCWRNAAASIEADCQTMPHARKQRLAVQLNNCHLQHAGRKPTRCLIGDRDERCVEEMQHNDVAFQSYTTFFHHVNAICHHLSHTVWQEQTEGLVRGLTASSLASFDRAEQSLEKQELVLRGQELASEQSRDIAEGLSETSVRLTGLSTSLSEELTSAMKGLEKQELVLGNLLDVQDLAATQASNVLAELGSAKSELALYMQAIDDDRRATRDQNMALADTIGFIHDCLENASSAWARFQAFTYLILATNLCWVLTTAPPLRSARTALFGLVALGLVLEKFLCEDSSGGTELPDWLVTGLTLATSGSVTTVTWTKVFLQEKIRWITFQAGAVVLAHALTSYYLPMLSAGRLFELLRGRSKARLEGSPGSHNRHQRHRRRPSGKGDRNGTSDPNYRGSPTLRLGFGGGRGGGGEENDWTEEKSYSIPQDSPYTREEDGYAENWNEDNHDDGKSGRTGRGSEAGQGGAAGGDHGAGVDDGLDHLSHKELQAIAKMTNGVVKANCSSLVIIRGLRDAGYGADGGNDG